MSLESFARSVENVRFDALKPGTRAGNTICTPGKTVPCGKVCRKPQNCAKGKSAKERIERIGKENLQAFAGYRKEDKKKGRSGLDSAEVTSIIQDAASKRIMPRDLKRGQSVKFMQWGMSNEYGVVPVYEREAVITSVSPSKVTFKPLYPNEGGQRPTSKLLTSKDGSIAEGYFYESSAQPSIAYALKNGRNAIARLEELKQEDKTEEGKTKDRDWYFRASSRNADIRRAEKEIEIATKTAQGLTRRDSLLHRIDSLKERRKAKTKKVFSEWKDGELNIGKSEKKVPKGKAGHKQAIAIALSEAEKIDSLFQQFIRFDRAGAGVPCGNGWIPRSKKCSKGKAATTPKEAIARGVKKAKEYNQLRGEVKSSAGMKPTTKRKLDPKELERSGEELESLFIRSEQIGNKYQSREEREAFQKQLADEVAAVGEAIDKQLPDTQMEAIDYSGRNSKTVIPSTPQRRPTPPNPQVKMPSTVSKFFGKKSPQTNNAAETAIAADVKRKATPVTDVNAMIDDAPQAGRKRPKTIKGVAIDSADALRSDSLKERLLSLKERATEAKTSV